MNLSAEIKRDGSVPSIGLQDFSAGATLFSNFALEGQATERAVIRTSVFNFLPGATPGTDIDINPGGAAGEYNPPSITLANNMAKGASNGSWSLSSDGLIATLDIAQDIVGVIGAFIKIIDLNSTTTYYTVAIGVTSNKLDFRFIKRNTQTAEDMTAILAAGTLLQVVACYITSS